MDGTHITFSSQEIGSFCADLGHSLEMLQKKAYEESDWATLSLVQKILSLLHLISPRTNLLVSPQWASGFGEIVCLVDDLAKMHVEMEVFRKKAREIHECLNMVPASGRNVDFMRRLLGMHRFLDGISGTESFGAMDFDREDVRYGLGIGLNDGSLLRFFNRIQEKVGENTESFLRQYFDEDTPALLSAIQEGQASLEAFLHGQFVLRFDPVLARKQFHLSEPWQAKFGRLASEPMIQDIQVDMVAGKKYDLARQRAKTMGIRRLRGFAMLFDVGDKAGEDVIETVERKVGESQKCLSLADEVLSRMHGHVAAHWQSRLSSVFHGSGVVEDRIYREQRFFGDDVERKEWENIDFSKDDDRDMPSPVSGHTYVIRLGDRLSGLARQAYGKEADYRMLLRQNPQIAHPDLLPVGMRIFFPDIRREESEEHVDANTEQENRQRISIVQDSIWLGDREIGHVTVLSQDQIKQLCRDLEAIPVVRLYGTVSMPLQQGIVISCDNHALLVSNEENERKCAELYPDCENPMHRWGARIASAIRGDVGVTEGIHLPLSDLPGQSHRRAWMATSLRRLLEDRTLHPVRLVLHAAMRGVDIVDRLGEMIVRLEPQDFEAIRMQPWRRLRDYVAPPIVQMNMLTQLWISDLLGNDAEIAVSPLSHVNEYSFRQERGTAMFMVPMGTPVYAMCAGKIRSCVHEDDGGYTVTVDHHGGLRVTYGALAAVCIREGQDVNAETMIARSGMGECEGSHEPMLRLELSNGERKRLDYFDVVYNLWTSGTLVDCVMGE